MNHHDFFGWFKKYQVKIADWSTKGSERLDKKTSHERNQLPPILPKKMKNYWDDNIQPHVLFQSLLTCEKDREAWALQDLPFCCSSSCWSSSTSMAGPFGMGSHWADHRAEFWNSDAILEGALLGKPKFIVRTCWGRGVFEVKKGSLCPLVTVLHGLYKFKRLFRNLAPVDSCYYPPLIWLMIHS